MDVFASASPRWMDAVQDEGPGVEGRTDFAKNRLAIIVPTGNPAGIEGIEDLAEDDVKLVLAAEGASSATTRGRPSTTRGSRTRPWPTSSPTRRT